MPVHPSHAGTKWSWKRASAVLGVVAVLAGGCEQPPAGEEAREAGPTSPMYQGAEEAFPGRQGEVLQGTFDTPAGPRELTYERIDGVAVFQGDILLPAPGVAGVSAASVGAQGATRSDGTRRWPGGVVPYTVDATLPNTARITNAIAHWQDNTPIRFVPRTTQADYVTFRPSTGCSSSVGRAGGQQFINLADGCSTGSTIHEIGHALGMWHEQSRTDRDRHILIHWANIESGKEHNFQTYEERGEDGRNAGPYDLSSMMHYSSTSFSSNGQPTITRLDGTSFSANRTALTDTDICAVKRFYGYARRSDVNGDGYADLVVGTPYEDVGTVSGAGALSIIYGTAAGPGSTDQLLHRELSAVEDVGGASDYFGWSVAVGDFNGDCFADVAVGVPYDDVNGIVNAGSVHIFYGSVLGASVNSDAIWHQDSPGVPDSAETGDLFGYALTVGDFNGDGYDDLAVGTPYEDYSTTITDSGQVNVLPGSASGLTGTGAQSWYQTSAGIQDVVESGDLFGYSLAAGDFNRDGFEELVVGVPYEDVGTVTNAGAVHVLYGTIDGLRELGDQLWMESNGSIPGIEESSDLFGYALAAGDFNGDGIKDLAISVPYQDVSTLGNAGSVTVLYGTSTGLLATGAEVWNQDSAGISGGAEDGDLFGRSLVAEDFDGDGYDDLAVGVPYDDVGTIVNAGAINVMYGGGSGVASGGQELWTQDSTGVSGDCEDSDLFGYRLAAGDYNGDGYLDLTVGVPYEDIEATVNAGAVNVMFSNSSGLSSSGQQLWWQGTGGLQDTAEASDLFGYGL